MYDNISKPNNIDSFNVWMFLLKLFNHNLKDRGIHLDAFICAM